MSLTFNSPGWLLLLVPWAGLAGYLLRRVRRGTGVPFLRFWPVEGAARPRARLGVPAVWVLLLLGAVLTAIFASARPGASGADSKRSAVVIVDRGRSLADPDRYAHAVAEAVKALDRFRVGGRVRLVVVPAVIGSERDIPADQISIALTALAPTALDATADVQSAVDRLARETTGAIVVVTGSAVRSEMSCVIGVGGGAARPMSIDSLSVRAQPRPQAMVKITNGSTKTSAPVLLVSVDGKSQRHPIGPISAGGSTTEFIDLPAAGESISAGLESPGSDMLDGRRWVVRQTEVGKLAPTATVSPAVQRLTRIYSEIHVPTPGAPAVTISTDPPADPSSPAVILETPGPAGPTGPVLTENASITRDVYQWPAAGPAGTAPAGFHVVATEAGVPIVATGVGGPPRVWINLDLPNWSASPAFAVFFSNVFDFVTGGTSAFGSVTPARLGPEWRQTDGSPPGAGIPPGLWPGIFRAAGNGLLAVNPDPASMQPIVVPVAADIVDDGPSAPVESAAVLALAALAVTLAGLLLVRLRRASE